MDQKPFPSVADGFFLLFYPLMLWGLLRFAVGRRNFSERVRLGLDLAVVAIAMWAVAGSAQKAPGALSQGVVEARRARASWPHLASAVGFAVLIVVLRHAPFFPDVSLAVTAVVIAALVSARQFFAQRELISIQRRSSYQSLHDVLTGLPNRRSLGFCRRPEAASLSELPTAWSRCPARRTM
jgi:hypothetical protein